MSDKDTENDVILVDTTDAAVTRRRGPKELKVEVLADNVNLFLGQIETILQKAPEEVGEFRFTEFVVSAEISGRGSLTLMGTGVDAGAKGGLTFKFQRNVQ